MSSGYLPVNPMGFVSDQIRYIYVDQWFDDIDSAEYESVTAEMAEQRRGESDYGVCRCGNWMPYGFCSKGH